MGTHNIYFYREIIPKLSSNTLLICSIRAYISDADDGSEPLIPPVKQIRWVFDNN